MVRREDMHLIQRPNPSALAAMGAVPLLGLHVAAVLLDLPWLLEHLLAQPLPTPEGVPVRCMRVIQGVPRDAEFMGLQVTPATATTPHQIIMVFSHPSFPPPTSDGGFQRVNMLFQDVFVTITAPAPPPEETPPAP